MLIAQITDTHIRRRGEAHQFVTDTSEWLRRAVSAINALATPPDVVIATGDIANSGDPMEYVRARAILDALAPPLFVIPGNHDKADVLERVFADRIGTERAPNSITYVIDEHPVRLLAIDSTGETWPGALLDDERLQWIERVLAAAPERPTFVFMHHPPFRTGMHYLDAFGIRGGRAFKALVEAHPQIVRIACGHIHRAIERPWNGTTMSTSVSTAPQFIPELLMQKRVGITRERPGFTLYDVTDVGTVRSRICFTGD